MLLKEPVSKVSGQLDTPKDMVPNLALKVPEEIQIVLKPFLDVTNWPSSASNLSISQTIPLTNLLKIALPDLRISHREVRDLVTRLMNELNSRFEGIEYVELYSKATILDPRFKNNDFHPPSATANAIKN